MKFMAGALDRFFKKINFTNSKPFENTDVKKVVIHKLESTCDIHIANKNPLDVNDLEKLKEACKGGFDDFKKVDILVENEHVSDQDILSYIKYYLQELSKKSPSLRSLKGNDIIVLDKEIRIEVKNSVENNLIVSKKDKIISWLDKSGLTDCNITTFANEDKRKKVKEKIQNLKTSLEVSVNKPVIMASKKTEPVLEIKDPAIYGVAFKDDKVTLSLIDNMINLLKDLEKLYPKNIKIKEGV